MAETNNQNPKNFPDKGGEKELLTRAEIKTMQKDISQIREKEAEKERERISKIRTEDEAARERERMALAQKEASARQTAAAEERRKEEELKRMRLERERKEALLAEEEKAAAEPKVEMPGGKCVTNQTEEEERKRFLERVAAKAEGQPAAPMAPVMPAAPVPSPFPRPIPPKPIERPAEKATEGTFLGLPKKPSFFEKIWARIIATMVVLTMMGGIVTFWYWLFLIREKTAPTPEIAETTEEELVIPPSFISTDAAETLTLPLLGQAASASRPENQLTRLITTDNEAEKVLSFEEFFEGLGLTTPEGFTGKLKKDFTLFVFSQSEGQRLGLIAKIDDAEGLDESLAAWEPKMENDLANLFTLMDKEGPAFSPVFKNASYEGASFRFQTFSRQDLGVVYAVFNDYFILTSSWKSMEKALQKLKEEPVSFLPFSPASRAEFILRQLTLREKIGQLFLVGFNEETLSAGTLQLLNSVQPGGVLLLKYNIDNAPQLKKLTADLQKTSLGYVNLPLFVSVDQEGEPVARVDFLEEQTPQREIADSKEAYYVGLARGEELKGLGINLNLAPVLDLSKPDDFLFSRSFQKNIAAIVDLAKSLILGQKQAEILTAVKHFPGYSDITFNPEKTLAVMDKTPETSQFQEVMASGPELVMTSNVIYKDIDAELPFSFSKKGIDLLKERLGDDSLIITDDLSQDYLLDKFSLAEVVTLPVKAGADVLIFSGYKLPSEKIEEAAAALYEAVQNGEISEARINRSVLKIIQLKENLVR